MEAKKVCGMAALTKGASVAKPHVALILIFFLPNQNSGPGLQIGGGISLVKIFNEVIQNTICKGPYLRNLRILGGKSANHSIVDIA
jgi:hypothetical protein